MSQAGPRPSSFYVERQLLTRLPATPTIPGAGGAPLLTSNQAFGQTDPGIGNPLPGDGLVLAGLTALVVSVYANPSCTLSGSGSLLCWIFNPFQQAWTRCPQLDCDLTTSSETFNARTFGALENTSRLGMLINWTASSVAVSGGTDVLVRVDGFMGARWT